MARAGEAIRIGRYELSRQLAAGGMAAVHLGRIHGAQGFSRVVIIKRILPEYAQRRDFGHMFVNEARLAARVRHPNVVATLDAVEHEGELLLVLEFVNGLSLAKLVALATERGARVPLSVGAAIVASALRGVHAAHEAKDEQGNALTIVHRDVSPQNILVGRDGLARVLDFGVAKSVDQARNTTLDGEFKGKLTYAAPEQVSSRNVSRATDVYAAGVVLWELTTGRRRYGTSTHGQIMVRLAKEEVPMPSSVDANLPPAVDRIVGKAMQRDPQLRYRSAAEMARDIEEQLGVASQPEVAAWVSQVGAREIAQLERLVAAVEANGAPLLTDLATSATVNAQAPTLVDESFASRIVIRPARDRAQPAARRRWVPVLGLVVGAAIVLGAASLVAAVRDGSTHASKSPRGPGPLRAGVSFSSVAAKDAPAPVASATVPAPRRVAATPPLAPTSTGSSRAVQPDCAPPYFFDPNGIKHVKPGCG